MIDFKKEISLYIDNELSPERVERLEKQLSHDKALQERMARYLAIRLAIKKESLSDHSQSNMVERVRAALEDSAEDVANDVP